MHRHPAVSGFFYKDSSVALKRQVETFLSPVAERKKAIGIVSPHAGLIYSGSVAGAVYSSIEIPDTVVLIGPNHTGLGEAISLMAKGTWETPLGIVDIDEALAAAVLSRSPHIHDDTLAHLREHSLEVQLPFIQYFKQKVKIVPIQMLDVRLASCLELGQAVAEAIKLRDQQTSGNGQETTAHDVLIVASSDMSHYEEAARAKDKDLHAIKSILDLDPEGLYRTVKDRSITMCGYGPVTAMLSAAKALGATRAELIKYANSGDISGDYEKVVGYAGIVVS